MLIHIAKDSIAVSEETDLATGLSGSQDVVFSSIWVGHPLQLSATLRDGTRLTMALTKSECAELYMRMHSDDQIRDWADTMVALNASEYSYSS